MNNFICLNGDNVPDELNRIEELHQQFLEQEAILTNSPHIDVNDLLLLYKFERDLALNKEKVFFKVPHLLTEARNIASKKGLKDDE